MTLAQSKLTAQGQISVPAKVRQRLGIGPGAVIEWTEDGDRIFVRKAGRYSSREVHEALFEEGSPSPRTLAQLKRGVGARMRKKYAGD